MVALSAVGISVQEVTALVPSSECTVRRWIRRSETTGDLHDRPRSGRRLIYTEESQLRLIAFYCQTQPLPNCGRWTTRVAAAHLRAQPEQMGASPSKSTIHRILRKNKLKPHLSRYFLHITDPDFFPKMEHLVALYANPPRYLFFFDECPGIQIIKRLTPDLQTDAMKRRLEEFEYIRNGTMDVFAFLNHADGKVVVECHAEHSTETLAGVFGRHVAGLPQNEPLHYVMDNLSTHRSYPFCQVVAELSGVTCPSEDELNDQAKRMQWLARQDKRIVVHFTPFHGSWLNMVESWFRIMGAKVLRESFGSADELLAALLAFADQWNVLLAHPFRWTYKGEGLHEKAVKRFTAMLRNSPEQFELRTLTKLLKLMTNLLLDYFSKVPEERWHEFAESLQLQSEALDDLIGREPGPRRKKNAQQALDRLHATLLESPPLVAHLAA